LTLEPLLIIDYYNGGYNKVKRNGVEMTQELIKKNVELEQLKRLVTDDLTSPYSRMMYGKALTDFLDWYQGTGKRGLTKAVVAEYKTELQNKGYAPATINQKLSAIRKLALEAADNGLMDDQLANGVARIKGVKSGGVRTGNWLTLEQAQRLLSMPDITTLKGLRDRAILAVMLGAGLRRSEVASLTFEHIQQREGRWVIVDLVGKRNKIRSVPIPSWTKQALDEWAGAAGLKTGRIFRAVNKGDRLAGDSLTSQAVADVVKQYAEKCGYQLAAHDLRRTYAKLARKGGAELSQIQLSLGHASVATTERYVGEQQDLTSAPCDVIRLRLYR
jgi:site-specific recombinase XerD